MSEENSEPVLMAALNTPSKPILAAQFGASFSCVARLLGRLRRGFYWLPPAEQFGRMDELITEEELANRIGVNRGVLRAFRARELGATGDGFWRRIKRVIHYTEQGAQRVLEHVKSGLSQDVTADDKKLLNGPLEELVTFVKGGFGNRRIIQAKRENGELINVRVHDSNNFRLRLINGEPMRFPAIKEKYGWVLKGRPPRQPGKW